jgi:hypothetical protein
MGLNKLFHPKIEDFNKIPIKIEGLLNIIALLINLLKFEDHFMFLIINSMTKIF